MKNCAECLGRSSTPCYACENQIGNIETSTHQINQQWISTLPPTQLAQWLNQFTLLACDVCPVCDCNNRADECAAKLAQWLLSVHTDKDQLPVATCDNCGTVAACKKDGHICICYQKEK